MIKDFYAKIQQYIEKKNEQYPYKEKKMKEMGKI